MKTSLFLTTALAAVLAPRVFVLALDKCNYAVVAPQLHSLGPEITACHGATGYYLAPPPAMPTPAQQQGICTQCTAFITKVTPMVWPECTLNLAGTDQTLTAFFNSVIAPCSATNSPKPTTNSPTPTTNSPTTNSPTTNSPTTNSPTIKPTDAPSLTPAPTDAAKPTSTPTTTEPTSC